MLNSIKEFIVFLFKDSWFKMLIFVLIVLVAIIIFDLSNIHKDTVVELEAQLMAGEITYEQAAFIKSATHEQIIYQVSIAIILALLLVTSLIMEQNSKLRDRVEKVDYRLWQINRNIDSLYVHQSSLDHELDREELDILDQQKEELMDEINELKEQYETLIDQMKKSER